MIVFFVVFVFILFPFIFELPGNYYKQTFVLYLFFRRRNMLPYLLVSIKTYISISFTSMAHFQFSSFCFFSPDIQCFEFCIMNVNSSCKQWQGINIPGTNTLATHTNIHIHRDDTENWKRNETSKCKKHKRNNSREHFWSNEQMI